MELIDSKVEYDGTDHFQIICEKCNVPGIITTLSSDRVGTDKVTRIHLKCPNCKLGLYRKIYWNNKFKLKKGK